MAIGLVDDALFEQELAKLNIPADKDKSATYEVPNAIVRDPKPLGRGEGTKNVPEPVRELVAELAINGVPHKEISQALQVSQSSISAYQKGATSTATIDTPVERLANHVKQLKLGIATKAKEKLDSALDNITDDKIKDLSANKLGQLARDMSSIVKDMSDDDTDNERPVQVVFFSPRPTSRNEYDVIVANE